MKITCDAAKGQQALRERGLDFEDARQVFAGRVYQRHDRRRDYGEVRWQTVGFLDGRMVMVVWTPRGAARQLSR